MSILLIAHLIYFHNSERSLQHSITDKNSYGGDHERILYVKYLTN